MSFDDKKGIVIASGFKLQAETMLDARQQVDTIQERDELVTIKAATPGLRVYVKNEKKSYVYNGTGWDELSTGAKYTHPTGDGYHHVPATGTTNNGKFLKAGSTAGSESWQNIKTSDIIDFPTSLPTKNNMVVKFNGGAQEGTNMFTFNGSAAKTVNITPSAIGAAAASHGTHVTYSTTAPLAPGTASAGSAATVARSDHRHPVQTTVSGNAGSATKLQTARKLNGVSFNGTADVNIPNNYFVQLTNQDLNNYGTEGTCGEYYAGGGNSVTNKPSGVDHFYLRVFRSASGHFGQRIYEEGRWFTRFSNGTDWSAWSEDYNTVNKPTASEIGAAASSHNHSASNITSGTLPISRGGTGATTADAARTAIGAAASSHTHNYAGSSSAGGAANSVKTSLVIKLNGGSTEGTNMFTFNGATAKSINITPSNIGAAASSHTHTHTSISDFDGAVKALLPSIPTKLPNPQVLTFTGAVNDTYDGSAAKTINIPTSGSTDGDLVVQLNGGTTEDTNKFTFDGSDDKTINITPSKIGAAASSHTHNYAGSSSAGGAANSVKTSLIVKLNNGSSEGTNMFTFNGSAAKTINITPAAIGAAASSHTHTHTSISDFDDAVKALLPSIPTKLPNPQGLTISLNGTSQGAYDGSAAKNINITPTSIGAAASSHTHTAANISDFDEAVGDLIPAIPTKLPNPQVLKFTGAVNDTYDGSVAKTINIPTSGSTDGSLIVQLNGGTTEDTNKFTFNGSDDKTVNITPSKIGAAASSHSHNYAGSSSAGGAANSVKTSLVIKLNGGTTEGTNMFTFNGAAAKSINITPAAIGAAAASHGTHVTYGSDAPKANGTASAGTAASVSRSDHVHPAQTYVQNAGSATKLATARTIDGVSFNGTSNITHYGTCSTAAGTAAKTVSLTGFTLATGAIVTVKFTVTNTAANPTLNVNGTGAKAIMYRGSAISAGYLAANRVYIFVYDGTDYELIGDINTDTNTTYNTGTSSTPGLTKLYTGTGSNTDGTMTQDAITDALTGKAPSSHTHNYAGSSSAGGAANSVKTSLVIKLNGGTTEGTNMFTFNGATAKSVNITPSAIGAAASSHTHNYAGSSSAGGAATSANKLNSTILTNQNLNDYHSGVNFYSGAGGNTCTNKPSGVDNFGMFVFQTAGGWWTQMLYGSDDDLYTRRWNGTNWSSWSKVYTTTNKPTASDIGAAASSHTHNYAGSSSAGGAATSANKVPVPVGTVLFSTSNSTTFFNACFGGTWTIVGNVVANIDAASGSDSTLTLYMFRKTAA